MREDVVEVCIEWGDIGADLIGILEVESLAFD